MSEGIAVLVATCGRPAQLEVALRSVAGQDVDAALDIVVVEDGPCPENDRVLEAVADPRVRRVACPKSPGRGYATTYLALETVEMPWVAYCEDDDVWLPDHLTLLLRAADGVTSPLAFSRPTTVVPGSAGEAGDLTTSAVDARELTRIPPDAFAAVVGDLPRSNVLHRLDDLDRIGGWPLEYETGAPAHVWTRLLENGATPCYSPWVSAVHLPADERRGVADSQRALEQRSFLVSDPDATAALRDRIELATQSETARRIFDLETELRLARQGEEAVVVDSRRSMQFLENELREMRGNRDYWRTETENMRATNWWRLGQLLVPLLRRGTGRAAASR